MILNDNIKLIREKAGIPQTTFAGLFGISVSNLKSYENMNVSPKRPILARIAKFAGIPVEQLLTKPLTLDDIKLYTEDAFADDEKEKDRRNMIKVQKGFEDAFRKISGEQQNEYIDTFKLQEQALSHFRDLLKDINDQRMIDVKVLIGRTDELSKRLDRLEAQFDETRNGLLTYIKQVDKSVESLSDEFYTNAKETEKEMKEINTRLDKVDPPNYDNDL